MALDRSEDATAIVAPELPPGVSWKGIQIAAAPEELPPEELDELDPPEELLPPEELDELDDPEELELPEELDELDPPDELELPEELDELEDPEELELPEELDELDAPPDDDPLADEESSCLQPASASTAKTAKPLAPHR